MAHVLREKGSLLADAACGAPQSDTTRRDEWRDTIALDYYYRSIGALVLHTSCGRAPQRPASVLLVYIKFSCARVLCVRRVAVVRRRAARTGGLGTTGQRNVVAVSLQTCSGAEPGPRGRAPRFRKTSHKALAAAKQPWVALTPASIGIIDYNCI